MDADKRCVDGYQDGTNGPANVSIPGDGDVRLLTEGALRRLTEVACLNGRRRAEGEVRGTNAEVFAEVAATRLLWALGFAADRMYPVRVICRGCPRSLGGSPARTRRCCSTRPRSSGRCRPRVRADEAWSWKELDAVDEKPGGAPLAHRDALKLLAVFMQHTDTKPQQQRVMCMGKAGEATTGACARPFMMVSDLGLTFGRANMFNVNGKWMHLVEWAATPVWKDAPAAWATCRSRSPAR